MRIAYLGPKGIGFIIPNKNFLRIVKKPLTFNENPGRVLVTFDILNSQKMVCPISGCSCIDCAIYRARHYYICHGAEYSRGKPNADEDGDIFELFLKKDLEDLEGVIRNVEEFIERSEL